MIWLVASSLINCAFLALHIYRTEIRMGLLDDKIAALQADDAAVKAKVAALQTQIADLKSQLAAGQPVTQAQLDALDAIHADLAGVAAP